MDTKVEGGPLSGGHKLFRGHIRTLHVGADLMHLVGEEADLARALLHVSAERCAVPAGGRAHESSSGKRREGGR